MARKVVFSKETVRALKKMDLTTSRQVKHKSKQKGMIVVSFTNSGVTIENSWSIKQINKFAKLK